MKVTGKITEMLEVQSGTSKAGKEWKTQSFVIDTSEEYNNIICFDVFGEEKVNNLGKFNKVGDLVDVEFNVSSRSWTNEKTGKTSWFTKADAWKIFKADADKAVDQSAPITEETFMAAGESDNLPF